MNLAPDTIMDPNLDQKDDIKFIPKKWKLETVKKHSETSQLAASEITDYPNIVPPPPLQVVQVHQLYPNNYQHNSNYVVYPSHSQVNYKMNPYGMALEPEVVPENPQPAEYSKLINSTVESPILPKIKLFQVMETDDDFAEYASILNMKLLIWSEADQELEMRTREISRKYQESHFKCYDCFKGFMTQTAFSNHCSKHDPKNGDFICKLCRYRFPTAKLLDRHSAYHRLHFQCKQCHKIIKEHKLVRRHFKSHTGANMLCKYCAETFNDRDSYLTHLMTAHPSARVLCDICSEAFPCQLAVAAHKLKAHVETQQRIKCEICDEVFTTYRARTAHREKAHMERERTSNYVCVFCGTNYNSFEALNSHIASSPNGVCDHSKSSCVQCGENFETEPLLKAHILELHGSVIEFKYKCGQCEKSFTTEVSRSLHLARAHKVKQRGLNRSKAVDCGVCGRRLSNKFVAEIHMRTHTGEKPYQCPLCPKNFSNMQYMQYHRNTHTNHRPYRCGICPKAFPSHPALNRHKRVHTGEKPHQCQLCHKNFTQSNSVKLHIRTVHMKLPAPPRARRGAKQPVAQQ